MAITQTQALPAPFITALGEKYGAGLAGLADQQFTTAQLGQVAPQVAAQTGLQTTATDPAPVPAPVPVNCPAAEI